LIQKCPIVDCAAPKGTCCMHCVKECTLCDKTGHYTGYKYGSVLTKARSSPPKYGKSTPIDADSTAVDGITDNSRLRMKRSDENQRNTTIGEQALNNKQEGDNTTIPSERKRSSSTPPLNRLRDETKTKSAW